MARKARKANLFSKEILILGICLIVVVFLSLVVVITFCSNAELIVMTAPSKATIRLDGKRITNGSRKIRAGKHRIELFLDGLESKVQEFEVSPNETKSINLYLTDENGGFSYYLNSEEDIESLTLVNDGAATDFISNYYKAKAITELLPLSIVEGFGDVSSSLELGKDCSRSYCLKITDRGGSLKEKMLSKIRKLGFNPDDYEIQYELLGGNNED